VTTELGIREVSEQTGLTEDLAVVRAKAADHRRLIALGLDCETVLPQR
jgi:hypothetical protein